MLQTFCQPGWIGAWYIIADHGQLWWFIVFGHVYHDLSLFAIIYHGRQWFAMCSILNSLPIIFLHDRSLPIIVIHGSIFNSVPIMIDHGWQSLAKYSPAGRIDGQANRQINRWTIPHTLLCNPSTCNQIFISTSAKADCHKYKSSKQGLLL